LENESMGQSYPEPVISEYLIFPLLSLVCKFAKRGE